MKNIKIIDIDGGGGIPGGGTPPTHTTESAITSKSPISSTQGTSYASWAGIAAAKVGGGTSYLVRIVIPDMPDDGSVWIALSTTKDITGALASWNKAGTYQVIVTSDESPDTQLYLVSVNMAGLDTTPTPPQVTSVQVNEYDDTYTPDPRSTAPALLQPIKFRDYVQAVLDKHKTGISWDNDSAEAIDTDSGYAGVGVFFDQGETIGQVIDMALQGYTACKWCDADGNMKFTRLVDPATLTPTSKKISVRVSNEQFFTGDGATSTAQLSVNGEDVVEANIKSIHQTDWQGRVELSSEARTNYIDRAFSAIHGAQTPGIDGVRPGTTTGTRFTSSGGDSYAVANIPVDAPAGKTYTFGVWLKTDSPDTALDGGVQLFAYEGLANVSAVVVQPSDTYGLFTITHTVAADSTATNLTLRIDCPKNNSATPGAYVDYDCPMLTDGATLGAYIPTTTSPVTITDYTASDTGQITLGQPLADQGTLDWTGDGTLMVAGVIDQNAMLSDLVPAQDTAPALSTRMGARRNWKKFADGDLVAPSTNFPPAVRQYLMADYQQVMASAKAINNTYIHAKYADPAPSAFDNADDAQTEIDRVCDIYTTQRWFYTTEVALDAVPGLDLGQVWRLAYPLYGLESGKNVMVTSFQPDFIANTAQITLWG